MMNRFHRSFRRLSAVLSAGILIQANGCAIDTTAIVEGLVASIAQSLVNNLIFGAFNLIGP